MIIILQSVYFICPTLGYGGAERVVLHLLNHLNRKRYQPWLILLKKTGEFLDQVPRDVPIIDLNKRHKLDFLKLFFLLTFRILPRYKPEIVVSFIDYTSILTLMASLFSPHKPKIIVRVGTNLDRDREYRHFSFFQEGLLKRLYPLAKKVIAVSEGVATDLIESFHIPAHLLKVIYNGVDPEEIRRLAAEAIPSALQELQQLPQRPQNLQPLQPPQQMVTLAACGHLSKVKNFPLLLEAYALLKKRLLPGLTTRLFIIGEGSERPVLEALIKQLGLEPEVQLLGFQPNPFKFLSRADIFILSSNIEGFPNTLLEAMACRVAVIATDCPSGPAEIIDPGVNGILVPVKDAAQLADSMLKLAHNPALREQLALSGQQRAEQFSLGAMLRAYEAVIAEQLIR